MTEPSEGDLLKIQQELALFIDEYGLSAILDNFSQLAINGDLEATDPEKMTNIATFLLCAADTAASSEADKIRTAFKIKDRKQIVVLFGKP